MASLCRIWPVQLNAANNRLNVDNDYVPIDPAGLPATYAPPWSSPRWETLDGRRFRCETGELTSLLWDGRRRRLSDWTPYNMFSMARSQQAGRDMDISDLRVAADVVADQDGLNMVLHLDTRGYQFEFKIADSTAVTRMRPLNGTGPWLAEQSAEVSMPRAGSVYQVEFWHVDQAMSIFVNGKRVGSALAYDWTPHERIEQAFGMTVDAWKQRTPRLQPTEAKLRWHFAGSPVTLHRVRVDRDLYYRAAKLVVGPKANKPPPGHDALVHGAPAFGTHPDNLAVLGPDQFFMLGDPSPASSDSRLWGNAHPYVVEQIDDSPFLVNRKLLLGKAWVVYFPAPYPVTENGRSLIPNFGRLRFIR